MGGARARWRRSGSARGCTRTGVYVGISLNEYHHVFGGGFGYGGGTGDSRGVASGRLAYLLGLRGPAMSVDTACSSGLVAVHLACHSLWARETNLVIAGGVNALLAVTQHILLTEIGAIAPDGRCKVFDALADGYARAEGCTMFAMRRHEDAQAAGDNVLAVIRASVLNQDGRTSSLTAPNGDAQRDLVREALAMAGVGPEDVCYVESHGTGTPLGDPIEIQALGEALGGAAKRRRGSSSARSRATLAISRRPPGRWAS